MTPGITINPASLPRPSGFSYAIRATGDRTVHFSGHTAVDAYGQILAPGDIVAQFEQVLWNLHATAQAAGLELSQVVKLTVYVTDTRAYQDRAQEIGVVYGRFFGAYYPAMTLVQVARLWDEKALIEIEGVAVG
jgi:enamine deaminase RidA (YjgF/YER057c/UK114 family)